MVLVMIVVVAVGPGGDRLTRTPPLLAAALIPPYVIADHAAKLGALAIRKTNSTYHLRKCGDTYVCQPS